MERSISISLSTEIFAFFIFISKLRNIKSRPMYRQSRNSKLIFEQYERKTFKLWLNPLWLPKMEQDRNCHFVIFNKLILL